MVTIIFLSTSTYLLHICLPIVLCFSAISLCYLPSCLLFPLLHLFSFSLLSSSSKFSIFLPSRCFPLLCSCGQSFLVSLPPASGLTFYCIVFTSPHEFPFLSFTLSVFVLLLFLYSHSHFTVQHFLLPTHRSFHFTFLTVSRPSFSLLLSFLLPRRLYFLSRCRYFSVVLALNSLYSSLLPSLLSYLPSLCTHCLPFH